MACAPTHLVWHFYHLAPVTVGGERSAVEPGEPDLVQRTGTFHGMDGWMDGWVGSLAAHVSHAHTYAYIGTARERDDDV